MLDLPPMPPCIANLPKDDRGYPVPWFVAWIDGVPDFRVIGPGKLNAAFNKNLCWICGQPRGTRHAFVIGPMCSVNRVSSEPPSHLECAIFAAKACPFLTRPKQKRNLKDMPEEAKDPAGIYISRNPGVTLVYVTRSFKPFNAGNGVLFQLGEPEDTLWYAEGGPATRAQVDASIASGLPLLMAEAEKEGVAAVAELNKLVQIAQKFLPTA